MERANTLSNLFLNGERDVSKVRYQGKTPVKGTKAYIRFENLASEECEDFFNYIVYLGLSKDKNLIVLPSSHHYYYDKDDLNDIKTMVNLRQLNQIKQIRDFLHSIYNLLPPESNFIGSFIDFQNQSGFFSNSTITGSNNTEKTDPFENGIKSRIPFLNMIYDIIDSRTNRSMTKKSVSTMLETSGFTVSDMTDLNGVTYFCSLKARAIHE